jgi:hypothetical protein
MNGPRPSKEAILQAGFDLWRAVEIAGKLKGWPLFEGEPDGREEQKIRCPCMGHEDANPSASMNLSKGVWSCPVCGCGGDAFAAVAAAMGKDTRTAFSDVCDTIEDFQGGGRAYILPPPTQGRTKTKRENRSVDRWVFRGSFRCERKGKPAEYLRPSVSYRYVGLSGTGFRKHRLYFADGQKEFRWTRFDADGIELIGRGGEDPLLYRFEELKDNPGEPVLFCEGEKDVDRARAAGFLATTLGEPKKNVSARVWEDLAGHGVVILPDCDEAGAKQAQQKVEACKRLGLRWKLVRLPGLGPKGDVSDFLDLRGAEALRELIDSVTWNEPLPQIGEADALEALTLPFSVWRTMGKISITRRSLMAALSWVQTEGYTDPKVEELKAILGPGDCEPILSAVIAYAEASGWHKQGRRGVIHGAEPGAVATPLDWSEAGERMSRDQADLLREILDRMEVSRQIGERDRELTAFYGGAGDGERARELKRVSAQLYQKAGLSPKAPRYLLKYTAGTGKTHMALEMILPVIQAGGKVLLLTPSHRLGDEIRDRAVTDHAIPKDLVVSIRGRAHPGACPIEEQTKQGDDGGIITQIQGKGLSSKGLCEHKNPVTKEVELCEVRQAGRCPYWNAMDRAKRPEPALVIGVHDYATAETDLLKNSWDLVIIDEEFNRWHKVLKISREDLLDPGIWREDSDHPGEEELPRVWEWLEGGCKVDQPIQWDFETTKKELTKLGQDPSRHNLLRPNVTKRAQDLRDLQRWLLSGCPIEGTSKTTARRVARVRALFDVLGKALKRGREVQAVHPVTEKARGKDSEEVREVKIRVELASRPRFLPEVPILVLDATADEQVARKIYGEDLITKRIDCARSAHVVQLTNSTYSKQYLGLGEAGGGERAARMCWDLIEATGADAVISYKEVVGQLTPRLREKGIRFAHFGALVGLNALQDCKRPLIIGRPEAAPLAVEAMARALNLDSPEPLNLTGSYERVLRCYELADGSRPGVLVSVHPDPLVQAVVSSIREGERIQALDRVRTVRPDQTGKTVFIACNVPIPGLVVNELTTADELLSKGPDRRLARVFDDLGALPLSVNGDHLAAMAPDFFPTVKAAEHALKRAPVAVKNQVGVLYPPTSINIYIESGGYKLTDRLDPLVRSIIQAFKHQAGEAVLVEYRAGKARRWAPALIHVGKARGCPETFLGGLLRFYELGDLVAFREVARVQWEDPPPEVIEEEIQTAEETPEAEQIEEDAAGAVAFVTSPPRPRSKRSLRRSWWPPPGWAGLGGLNVWDGALAVGG